MRSRLNTLGFVCVLLGAVVPLNASVTLFVEEPYGTFGALNPTGHAAIYLDRVCAETPTKLRRCEPGESGVVISRYHRVAGYDWAAVPLIPYLYAVDRPDQVPLTADAEMVSELRDNYRREHLRQFVPDGTAGDTPPGEWTQLVGASYDRKIYGMQIETTEEQDDSLIAELNADGNRSHFNLFFHNCADFSRKIIDFYYPHLARRSFTADMGITTPKQIARSLANYSKHHSDVEFSIYEIPQVPGELERSHNIHGVCESLVRSKKYVVPLTILHPWFAASFVVGYVSGGRLNLSRDASPLPASAQDPPAIAAWLSSRNRAEAISSGRTRTALLQPTN